MFKNLSTDALGLSGTQNETIELALSHGFKGIDLDIVDFGRQVETRGMAHSRRLIDSARLKIGCFKLPVDLEDDEPQFRGSLDKLSALGRLAADLGCTRTIVDIAPASDERPYHQNFELYRKRLAEVAGVLEPLGIRLGVGFRSSADLRQGKAFEFIHQLDPLLMLLGLVGKKNVGVSLDLWQLHAIGGGIDDIRKLPIEQIVTLQVADFAADGQGAESKEEARLLPGESGVIDTPAVLVALAEQGYDGPVTPFPGRNVLAGLRRDEIGKRAGQALDQVWKAAGLSAAGKLATAARK